MTQRGLVALRINYPFQAATLSATAPNPNPSQPNFRYIDSSDDPSFGAPPPDSEMGTYYGDRGLGNQRAFGKIVRPFRRLISRRQSTGVKCSDRESGVWRLDSRGIPHEARSIASFRVAA